MAWLGLHDDITEEFAMVSTSEGSAHGFGISVSDNRAATARVVKGVVGFDALSARQAAWTARYIAKDWARVKARRVACVIRSIGVSVASCATCRAEIEWRAGCRYAVAHRCVRVGRVAA